jgi:hypothetical protein
MSETDVLVNRLRNLAIDCDNEGQERAADLCREAADELDRLQAIVDQLPKTADGVPIAPGTRVWSELAGEVSRVTVNRIGIGGVYHDVYSTREAAEKARAAT